MAGRDDKRKRWPKLFLPCGSKLPMITDCCFHSMCSPHLLLTAACWGRQPAHTACAKDMEEGTGPYTPEVAQPAWSRWQA